MQAMHVSATVSDPWYFVWAAILVLFSLLAWASNLLTLPGNWLVVGAAAAFAYWIPDEEGRGIGWTVVAVTLGLAVLGELVEFAAGAAGAAKEGGSRRGMLLSIVGAFLGSLLGAVIGLPVPLFGTIVGIVVGGGVGAFCGAYLGEVWMGSDPERSRTVGKAAFWGRLFGTAGKLAVGAVIVIVVSVDAFL